MNHCSTIHFVIMSDDSALMITKRISRTMECTHYFKKKNSIFVIKKCRILIFFARNWNILHRKWSPSRQKWQLKCFMDNGLVKTLHLYKYGLAHSRTSRFHQILWNLYYFLIAKLSYIKTLSNGFPHYAAASQGANPLWEKNGSNLSRLPI